MKKTFFALLCVILLLGACNSNTNADFKDYEKCGDIYYKKHISNPETKSPKIGDAMFQQIGWGTKDSVVMPFSEEHFTILSEKLLSKEVVEIYELMHAGDSVTMIVSPKVFFRLYGSIPLAFSDNEMVYFTVKLNKVYSNAPETFETIQGGALQKIMERDTENIKTSFSGCVQVQQTVLTSKDSIISMEPANPVLISKDNLPAELYNAFLNLHAGDFACIAFNPTILFGETDEVYQIFGHEGKAYIYVNIVDVFEEQEFMKMMEEEYATNKEGQPSKKDIESAEFQEYMKSNNLQGKTTKSGLIIITEKEGYGKIPTKGQKVKVHYRGYFLDGTTFDSSYDRNAPIEFPLGEGYVIQGWEEAVSTMKVGGKAKLLIPSYLGYGSEERGGIPANSPLIFDVELISAE